MAIPVFSGSLASYQSCMTLTTVLGVGAEDPVFFAAIADDI